MSVTIFTDGGCDQQPDKKHIAGWGIYVNTPEGTIKACGASPLGATNNVAEQMAFIEGLKLMVLYGWTNVVFYIDSMYVINGTSKGLKLWPNNNWCKRDGSPVLKAEYWKQIEALVKTLESKGQTYELRWVKGHSGVEGNEHADTMASRGKQHARKDLPDHWDMFGLEPPQKQGGIKCSIHDIGKEDPLDAKPKKIKKPDLSALMCTTHVMDFVNNEESREYTTEKFDGKSVYGCLSFEDDDELSGSYLGKPSSVSMYSIVATEPQEYLDNFRRIHEERANTKYVLPYLVYLKRIMGKDVYEEFLKDGDSSLSYRSQNLRVWNEKLVTRSMSRMYLGNFAIGHMQGLVDKLLAFKEIFDAIGIDTLKNHIVDDLVNKVKSVSFARSKPTSKDGTLSMSPRTFTDYDFKDTVSTTIFTDNDSQGVIRIDELTDVFYERNAKGKQEFLKKHPTGLKSIEHNFGTKEKPRMYPLVMTTDLPDRNHLARLTKEYKDVRIFTVMYNMTSNLFGHFQVIVADEDLAIYESCHSSRKLR